jgi:hypothetical protein
VNASFSTSVSASKMQFFKLFVNAMSMIISGNNIYIKAGLKVHKIENFFGFDFEFCPISLLVMHK